jgi:hypothetical protein
MTKLCAEAMGLDFGDDDTDVWLGTDPDSTQYTYHPLTNDAQAMALIKKFRLKIMFNDNNHEFIIESKLFTEERHTRLGSHGTVFQRHNKDLNRAICECVASVQLDKHQIRAKL